VPSWLRKALHARDRGCRFPGCRAPVAWTDAHHLRPWARGGSTSLDNLALLCRWHHGLVHEAGWTIRLDVETGTVTAARPDGRPYECGSYGGGPYGTGPYGSGPYGNGSYGSGLDGTSVRGPSTDRVA
jgi:hypothetical protein